MTYANKCEFCGRSDREIASTVQGCFCHSCLTILISEFVSARNLLEDLFESEEYDAMLLAYSNSTERAAARGL